MSGLQVLQSRLGRLRYRRALTRWQTAICRVLVCTVLALAAVLFIDFSLRLETGPRIIVMLMVGLVLAWQVIRRVGDDLTHRETMVDVALLLERLYQVDSDLVAALQFDAAAEPSSVNGSILNRKVGSPELQRAVVERAAEISETLDFRSAVPKRDARRALSYAAIASLAVAVGWFAFPDHAGAFWNRLWLGNAQYPTRTRIDEVAVNGQTAAAHVVEGETVTFRVECTGVIPDEGIVRLQGVETGDSTSLVLRRVNEKSEVAIYVADGPPLNELTQYSIRIGDAETEPRGITLIQRPLVELTIAAAAPAYMQHGIIRQHEHYVQVLEGSAVEFSLRSTNGKRLQQARFELLNANEQQEPLGAIAFAPTDESGLTWHLDTDTSVLTRVVQGFQYRIVVVDEDALGTYHPVEGAVRVKADRAPAATLSSSHHVVMPNARPTIAFATEDDFGVGSIVLQMRRAAGREPAAEAEPTISVQLPMPVEEGPTRQTAVRAEHDLDLSPLDLAERDKVLVWLEVTDYRGEWPGTTALSEAIELEVMDQRGVLDAILRSDADAEQILTDAIEKELGLRGDR